MGIGWWNHIDYVLVDLASGFFMFEVSTWLYLSFQHFKECFVFSSWCFQFTAGRMNQKPWVEREQNGASNSSDTTFHVSKGTPASKGIANGEKRQRGESLYLCSPGLDIFTAQICYYSVNLNCLSELSNLIWEVSIYTTSEKSWLSLMFSDTDQPCHTESVEKV